MTIAPEHLERVAVTTAEPGSSPLPPVPPDADGIGAAPDVVVRVGAVVLAGALSSAGAAWLAGGLIRGLLPTIIALLGVVIGSSLTYFSFRAGRAAFQYAIVPVAAFVGAVLMAPEARGGTANLPSLVGEAIRGGGLVQPPIAFNPGWRFLLVVFFAIVSTAAVSIAVATSRPKLAVVIPLPILAGAAVLQPKGNEIVASSVAIVFLLAGLAVAYGATLTADDARELTRSFELRRLGRSTAMLAVVVIGIVALAQTDFLFPSTDQEKIIPPRRPPNVPLEKDRELFRVGDAFRGPLRLGVLDEYDGVAWLLPSEDPSRLSGLTEDRIPESLTPVKLRDAKPRAIDVEIVDMRGLGLPVPGLLLGLSSVDEKVEYDPRTGIPRLEKRLPQGLTYAALSAPTPTAAMLDDTTEPAAVVAKAFTVVPTPPQEVIDLLGKAPNERFTRLQFLREELYKSVELLGGGGPVDVTPPRVAEMLRPGAKATPFEVVAAEALLTRWGGIPGRIGYGYFGGDALGEGYSFRPKHGRAWLEAYFEGYGWVPLVGTPPKAAASLSQQTKLQDQSVKPSDDLALVVYIPVRRDTLRHLFELVRYWVLVIAPIVAGALALIGCFPILLKWVRSARRRRWGRAHGELGRVLVGYAEFRDRCYDLNVGNVRSSPVEFVEYFVPDAEHDELAWLVTRLFWGDLRRDIREEDVQAAQTLLGSVRDRIFGAQTAVNRGLAKVSRSSLRDPYNDDVPNFYPRPIARLGRVLRGVLRVRPTRWRVRKLLRLRPGTAAAAVLVFVVAVSLTGCGTGSADAKQPPAEFPNRIAPASLLGLRFVRAPLAEKEFAAAGRESLLDDGQVYTINEATSVQGSLQVSVFKREVDSRKLDVQRQVEEGLGGGFRTRRFGTMRIRMAQRSGQRIYVWFPPERKVMVLFVVRAEYENPDALVLGTTAYIRGIDPARVAAAVDVKG